MVIAWVVGALVVAGVLLWMRGRRLSALRRRAFEAELKALGLWDFNERLLAEVASGRRPMADLSITNRAKALLKAVDAMEIPEGQAAVLELENDSEREVFEVLVGLERLQPLPDGRRYHVLPKRL